MKNLISILVLFFSVMAKAQTMSPLPVAGQNSIVQVGSFQYMVNYPANIPAGKKVKVIAIHMGLGEDSAHKCDRYAYFLHAKNGWDLKQVVAPGDTNYFALIGLPHRGFTMNRYTPAIDAFCNWLVQQNLLDSNQVNNFITVTISKGGQVGWYYMTNYQTHNSLYYERFNNRTLTMSTMSTNGNVNAYSGNGRHVTFFGSQDGNTATLPYIQYAHHNKINASSEKRIDSVTWGTHSPGTWNWGTKVDNYDEPASLSTHNANTHLLDWLIDPSMGLETANQAPVANAGSNQSISFPTSSVTLTGSGTDVDGTIVSYFWTKISGGTANINSPTSASTSITGLAAGVYVFRLTVTDNVGAIAADDVQVTMTGGNQAPTANAGTTQTLVPPASSTTLSGSGSDVDGTIVSYSWTQVEGTTIAQINNPSLASTTVSALVPGSYTFRLTVTDDFGATGSATVDVVVEASPKFRKHGRVGRIK